MKQVSLENFQYVAWFSDNKLELDDEDYEWCACFWIKAPDKDNP